MRTLIVTGVLAALVISLLAIPASASFDHHFTVLERKLDANGLRFRAKLFNPQNRRDRVGREWGRCRPKPDDQLKCKVHFHLNGEIGGFGDIGVIGRLGPTDRRLNVAWGTRDFKEVAGKVTIHDAKGNAAKLRFDLVR